MAFPKIGDFVKVTSGPGLGAKGRVLDQRWEGPEGSARLVLEVKVASGGTWSFYAEDCTVLAKRAAAFKVDEAGDIEPIGGRS